MTGAAREPGIVIGILGPTGVGKTEVAEEVATRLGVDILSCDSMQIYRDFPVLTNQPRSVAASAATAAAGVRGPAQSRLRHRLVGFLDPASDFSAAEYAEVARPLIEQHLADHGAALLVGGTGLYMRAALAPLAVAPVGDPALRRSLEERAAASGAAALHEELGRIDPAAAAAIDPQNTRRVVRALEVIMTTGRLWSGRDDLWRPRYRHPTLLVGLVADREEIYARIERRTPGLVAGAIDEVRRFRERASASAGEGPGVAEDAAAGAGTSATAGTSGAADLPPSTEAPAADAAAEDSGRPPSIAAAIGFTEISRYLDGVQSLEETVEQVTASTRRYARRQLTWIQKVDGLVIIDVHGREPGDVADTILRLAEERDHVKEPQDP